MKKWFFIAVTFAMLTGCAAPSQMQTFQIGSAASKNVFITSDQFANNSVRVRLRNSSGDPDFSPTQMRMLIENGLSSAGYKVVNDYAGIVVDVNLYFVGNVVSGRQRAGNEVGALLGSVAGYELSKGVGGIGAGSGAILGAIAGATLQDVIRVNTENDTYLVLCDVNIGVVRQESKSKDSFVIGGNRMEHARDDERSTFESFAIRDTIKVSVYAGDKRENRAKVTQAIQDRLARIVANLI